MAENEEDYLDGLLKSLSEDENAQSENKDEEEEQIKEQVREAFEKSNEKSSKFENIYDDDDGSLSDDNIDDLLKDVMTVPRHMAASDTEETFITDDTDIKTDDSNAKAADKEQEDVSKQDDELIDDSSLGTDINALIDEAADDDSDDTVSELTPEEVAKKAQEADEQTEADDTFKDKQADEAIDKMLDDTPVDEAAGTNLDKNDELMDDMGLSDTEKDRLASMNLDDLIGEMNDNVDESSMNDLLNEIGMQSEDEVAAEDTSADNSASSADNASLDNADNEVNAASDSISDNNGAEAANTDSAQNNAFSADEEQSGEDKASKKKKRKKKEKKKDKKGIFSIIKDIFFESIEDDLNEANVATGDGELLEKAVDNAIAAKTNTSDDGKEQDENEKLIDEVFHGKANLDQPEAPKKGLIAKIKYRYQQFKIKQEKEGKLEEEQEEIENQQKAEAKEAKKAQAEEKKKQAAAKKEEKKKQAKQAKDKKPKKEKKPKKVKVKEPPKPGDILKIKPKSIILFILLIAGIIMLIQVFSYSINYSSKVNAAKDYFINGEYEKAYNSLSGMNLSGNEETIYNQSKVVMYVQRQYESYLNYRKMNMNTEAINALIKGVDRYQTYRAEGKELGVDDKMKESYDQIINALKDTYKISETEAISLADMSNSDFVTYYYKIEAYGEAVK